MPSEPTMKLCVMCRHLGSQYSTPGGGCDTCGHGGGEGFTLECGKGHFYKDAPYSRSDFYGTLRTAQTCADFDPLTDEEIANV